MQWGGRGRGGREECGEGTNGGGTACWAKRGVREGGRLSGVQRERVARERVGGAPRGRRWQQDGALGQEGSLNSPEHVGDGEGGPEWQLRGPECTGKEGRGSKQGPRGPEHAGEEKEVEEGVQGGDCKGVG